MTPLRVFIGYDSKEPLAYHVLSHSILRRASLPVSITPLAANQLAVYRRRRQVVESTEFSISRFLVPYLSGYEGVSVYMDCDMLCLADIWDLVGELSDASDKALWCCQHQYEPKKLSEKMLGAVQTFYPRKNWSSLMMFQNDRNRALTPERVNTSRGLDLHALRWLRDDEIGSLPLKWNWLVGEYPKLAEPKNVHYTIGGPWWPKYSDVDYAAEWFAERDHMLK